MFRRGFTVIHLLLGLAAVAIVATGIVYTTQRQPQIARANQNVNRVTSVTPPTEWVTYTDERWKFSFRHPAGSVTVNDVSVEVTRYKPNPGHGIEPALNFGRDDFRFQLVVHGAGGELAPSARCITDRPGTKIVYLGNVSGWQWEEVSSAGSYQHLCAELDGRRFELQAHAFNPASDVPKRILDSFRFED